MSDNKLEHKETKPLSTRKAAEVKVENVHKKYGSQKVLHGIDFEVNSGETFVIMGPSGSGKSVLLKSIVGLEAPTKGRVLINGLDAAEPLTREKVVTSIVFQAGALFSSMTVFDNLAFYPREHKIYGTKEELETEVEKTLSLLSLNNAAHKYPSELSGGMRKRVAIARSLMVKPQLLLYDEPTSELDPIMAATISEIIATLHEQFHVTSIVVSHDLYLATNIADQVAIMFDGKFEVVAKPENLNLSDNPHVQEFLNPKIDLKHPRFRNNK